MRRVSHVLLLFVFTLSACTGIFKKESPETFKPLHYEVNLMDRADDLFHVSLTVNDLAPENAIYQFAATAPGTYQVMDLGRFVRSFEALDASGATIASRQISTNQWKIERPRDVRKIRYSIAETFDTPVDSNKIYLMAGTSIENDHVQLMGHGVFGYPTGMQGRPLTVKLHYPENWLVGTALSKAQDGLYYADNYDHMVDSPILMGRLSKDELNVDGTDIEVYTYSKTDKMTSKDILTLIKDVLLAANEFLEGLPVERYTFLFFFEDVTLGAWEHSYSSNYVYREISPEHLPAIGLREVVAHEFFHIVTPLNVHSEIIEQFDFVKPVPSQHLWLYEGTTEWAAHAMQLRSGLQDLDEYLKAISEKLIIDDNYDKSFSLRDLALQSFTRKGQKQYGNIYMRGAVVAGLLDIRLLELSDGKRGLREVMNQLSEIYGPKNAFSEEKFYDTFVELTYPEIAEFFNRYIKDTQPLPIAEYYGKLGIKYMPKIATGEIIPSAGFQVSGTADGEFVIGQVHDKIKRFGLQNGDAIRQYNGESVTLKNIGRIFGEFKALKAGQPYDLVVSRGGEDIAIECQKISKERIRRHVLTVDDAAGEAQRRLRSAWQKNL